ncbi:F-box only protein 11 [Operophtera brumata]|uniref:F-box only protein 11 n=1 Tax=Operophtera brumata TaxID=104452 RepID=A0A0L7L6U7_OPEBR|nr:F-box only protein 11 [Operophtera brumata]
MCRFAGEPCEVPCPNNVSGSAMAATAACAGPSGSGTGGGSPPVPAAAPASTAGHHSPYDLRRKSPPAYHEPGPSGSCSLPARKRPRTSLSQGVDVCNVSQYLQYELPDEVLLCILSHLTERDLCRVSQVCKRFNTIANDTELWKSLYQSVFEYDTPLMHPAPCQFEFVAPDECDADNPWKESFRQLYYGIHREAESTLTFAEGASRAYAGHMTLKFSPDATSTMQHHKHYCLEVSDNCSPTIDHCIIRSASVDLTYAGHMTLKFSPDATSTMQHHKHYCLEVSDNCSPTIDHCIIRSASVGQYS